MTLPFHIDPFAWPFGLVACGALFWIYTRPADHFLKQLWWYMVGTRVGQQDGHYLTHKATAGRAMFWFFEAVLLILTAASLAVCIGIFQNPPSLQPSIPEFDASKYEIVTEGHSIYARPKSSPPSTIPTRDGR